MQLGVHPALCDWVHPAEIVGGVRSGTTSVEAKRIAQLEREVRELRRANEFLRTSADFSPPRSSTARSSRSAHLGAGRLHRGSSTLSVVLGYSRRDWDGTAARIAQVEERPGWISLIPR